MRMPMLTTRGRGLAPRLARGKTSKAGGAQGHGRTLPVHATMLPKGTFEGKVALVTGGGTGLGKGIATKLSDLGATVAIMSRKRGVVDVAAKEIQELTGHEVIPLQGDVRDPEQVRAALDELDERAGIPTIVINNAYVAGMAVS
jgi:hypothetical protein